MFFGALGELAFGEFPSDAFDFTFSVDTGTFTWTGQSATLGATRSLPAGTGSVAWSGQSAGLIVARADLGADAASFSWSGQDASLRTAYVLNATPYIDVGGGTQIGFAAFGELAFGETQSDSESGTTFSWQAFDVGKDHVHILNAGTGAFVWSQGATEVTRVARVLRLRPGYTARVSASSGSTPRALARSGGGGRYRMAGGREC